MSSTELNALLPLTAVGAACLVALAGVAVRRNVVFTFVVTILGFAVSGAALFASSGAQSVGGLLVIDPYARFFSAVLLASNAGVALLAFSYFRSYRENREELFILLLLETLGGLVLVSAVHFASFFLGLELLSVSLYSLLAYVRTRKASFEAGVKYFVPAAVASAFLLFGMALLYDAAGTMDLAGVGRSLARAGSLPEGAVAITGLVMVIVAIGFKLALAPFHMWAADVYQGASAPITASLASVSKVAVFALFFRFFSGIDLRASALVGWILTVVAILSMLVGSWLALRQRNVKRMLAYSSTAHLGYLMLPLLSGGRAGAAAAAFYLVAYSAATIALFGVITALSSVDRERDDGAELIGLAWRKPFLSAVFIAGLLSMAGIPLTAGFMGKFYLLTVGVGSSLWALAAALVLSSGISLFYYLKLVAVQFSRQEAEPHGPRTPLAAGFALAVAIVLVVGLGIYPGPLANAIASLAL